MDNHAQRWPPSRGSLLTLLRVGSVRFSIFYFVACYAAMLGRRDGRWSLFGLWFGSMVGIANCLAIELTNRCADRRQDAINCPERTHACATIGFRRLAVIAAVIYGLQIPLYLAWHWIQFNGELLAVQIVSWLLGWNYSVGLRLKQQRYGALVVLTATFLLPFLWGWTFENGRLADLPAAVLCMPAFVLSLAGAKDLTDVEGDAAVGYRGAFVDLVHARSAWQLLLVLAAPYVFCSVLVMARQAPTRLLLIWLLAPLSAAFALLARSSSRTNAFAVREIMYHLWLVVLTTLMCLLFPYRSEVLLALSAGAAWLLATRFLHWHSGLRRRDLRALLTRVAA